jgi:DNA-binding SARP family transcriptional activator
LHHEAGAPSIGCPVVLRESLLMALVRPETELRDLHIRLLGRFAVDVDQIRVRHVSSAPKVSMLLKVLALVPGHRLHREELAELVWPDVEFASAMNNLHRTLYALRRTLEPDLARGGLSSFVKLESDVVVLHAPGMLWVDVEAFEVAAAIARGARDPAAYESALDLYGGDLLPEDIYADWAATRRDVMREQRLGLLLQLAELYEQRTEIWAALRVLDKIIEVDAAHEGAHVQIMRLYALAGQRHRALRQYHRLVTALNRELDTGPDDAARRLYADILAGRYPGEQGIVRSAVNSSIRVITRLTSREVEIARLVAEGRTNRQIAAELAVSVRTADTHVGRILGKLGAASRREIAAWALDGYHEVPSTPRP